MCIFCRIIAGEIPATKVYEDDLVVAFLDISQATQGHTLVIPKQHVVNVLEASPEVVAHVNQVAARIAQSALSSLGAKGANIFTNANEIAGQSVFHYHVHVLPRYTPTDVPWRFDNHQADYTKEQLRLIANKLQSTLTQ